MTDLAERIHAYIDTDDAVAALTKYYSGAYTGGFFDQLESPDPNRITSEDVAAVALLSVPLPGAAVRALLFTKADEISGLLAKIPHTPLHEVEEAELQPLWDLQELFDEKSVPGMGHVRRSKLLAHKRPHLIPIRDQFVLTALVGNVRGSFTLPLRRVLQEDRSIVERLEALREGLGKPELSLLRVLDVVVWMATCGDDQVAD